MVILDVCAAYEIASKTEEGRVLKSFISPNEEVLVPTHFYVEFLNALSKYVRGGDITFEKAFSYFKSIDCLITKLVEPKRYAEEVLAESAKLKHPAYDMFYFVLARRHNAVLLTVDKRLANLCADNRVSCVHFVEKEEMLYD